MPRRARHLIPTQLPRRGEVIAACAVLLLLAHLLFAQLTLILALTFALISKATRWRRWWLTVPALAGAAWTLAIGPRVALAGFAAGPAQILAFLGAGGHPLSRLGQPSGAFSSAGSWLPRQFPIALVAAAVEAALAGWLDWVHTDEWAVPAPRPGVLAAVRSAANRRAIRAGAMVTRDGCALGVAPETGARVSLSWPEAAGGVLVTGAAPEILTITSFQLVHAGLRRRKPVIAVDMAGDTAAARAMAAVCAATGSPLRVFGGTEGCYEPFRQAGPARRLAMTLALLGADDQADRGAGPADALTTYLRAVFELMDAVPADPRTPVIEDVRHLLNPLALQARMRLVPPAVQRRDALADLVVASARLAQANPQALLVAARQLAAVSRPASADGLIDLASVVRERSAAFFRVGNAALARLICADLAGLGEDLRRIGVDADALVWLHGWEPAIAGRLAGLVTGGTASGLAVLVSAASPAVADLAGMMNTVLIHRLADSTAAASLAERTGTTMVPAAEGGPELVPCPAVPAQTLLSLAPARFVLTVNSPRRRLVRLGQVVPARLPRGARLDSASRPAGLRQQATGVRP
jgi:hypothetical protein